MRALVLSSVYPSSTRPTFGTFVRERIRHVANSCAVQVVAPVPWFPGNARLRGDALAATPRVESLDGIKVHHPLVLSVPRYAKAADAVLYAAGVWSVLRRIRREFPFDLIDAHFAYPDGVAAALLATWARCPVLITVRGDEFRVQRYRLRRLQMRWSLRRARVVAVSAALRDLAAGIADVDPARIRVIPNGVDAVTFHPRDRGASRARLGLPADRPILLSVGSLIERKGHHRIVEVLPTLVARHPDLLLVILGGEGGGDSTRPRIEALVRRNGLAAHVRLVRPQPHAEVAAWMGAADIFCLATRWEGWCNVLMEALACGLPVVTTRVGGNGEFVEPGIDGELVRYWDGPAFVAAVDRALLRSWDRAAIAARAAVRDWDHVAAAVVDEFHHAMARAA